MEFQVGYLALFRLFSEIIGFKWFSIESRPKNIQLKLVFLKDRFLNLLSSYYTLMTSQVLPGILSSMLLIHLSTLNVIGYLICDKTQSWLLNLNLTYRSLWTVVGSTFFISNTAKTQFVLFDQSNNSGAVDAKIDGSVLEKKYIFRCWDVLLL